MSSINFEDKADQIAQVADMPSLSDVITRIASQHPDFDTEMEEARVETSFAIALANARRSAKLSQSALAEMSGIKQPQIARYEKGSALNVQQIVRIAKALNRQIILNPDASVTFGPPQAGRSPDRDRKVRTRA